MASLMGLGWVDDFGYLYVNHRSKSIYDLP